MNVRHALAAFVVWSVATQASAAGEVVLDLLVTGGTIHTGDPGGPIVGDVGIAGDRIVFVGTRPAAFTARRVIDARGLVVAPGFIDAHTHADVDLFDPDPAKRLNAPFLTQGVTTAVIGNDGFGGYDIAAQAERMRAAGIGTNAALYVGFGPVRESQLGKRDAAPDATQLAAMESLVARGMCEGAIGLSTGLFYNPQNFAKTDEVIALAKVAARHGGLYDSHIRDESSYNIGLKGSIDEVIRIGREAGLPVHVAHIKALGVDTMGQSGDIIRTIEAARAGGLDITADQYPWIASSTRLSAALMPDWSLDGGRPAMLARFDDPALADRLAKGITDNLRLRGGPDTILFTAGNPRYVGRRLSAVMAEQGRDAVATVQAVLREGDLLVASFNQSEDDVRAFMRRPWVMTSSDSTRGHPRAYASFAEKYGRYVVQEHVLSIDEFVVRSAALTADTLGIARRGHLRPGWFADVVVFDPQRFRARATYEQPTQLSEGVVAVIVNGTLAIDDGRVTGSAAGRPLLRDPPPACR